MTVLSLELNELNFHFVQAYVRQGQLPTFAHLFETRQLTLTRSEKGYPNLEPWIQWPTVYNGKTYEEHQIFRLGDVTAKDHEQIWEHLEKQGCKVGAISPMNASNRCADPAFFLPDPWTNTKIVGDQRVTALYKLIRQVVNNNASDDLSIMKLGRQIAPLAIGYIRPASVMRYLRILKMAVRYKWAKAAFLDSLLCDLTMGLIAKHSPDYVSLFLNAGAHIQHHHMFDSDVYEGQRSNPGWYSKAAETNVDPLLFIYSIYDGLIADCLRRSEMRVLITTGLSQVANERDHYQYRIVDFDATMRKIGLDNVSVEPRMSRDFLLRFPSADQATAALQKLDSVECGEAPLFRVENRGDTLFCQVGYFGPPEGLDRITVEGLESNDWGKDFTLVSIENGIHQTIGYHIDSAVAKGQGDEEVPLKAIFGRLAAAALEVKSRPSLPLAV